MNIDDFEIPGDDEDYHITSAEEILQQTQRAQTGGECVVYSLFSRPLLCSTEDEAVALLHRLSAAAEAVLEGYIWSREQFKLRVVEDLESSVDEKAPTGQKYYFLQGCTVYGDCIDDEWFIVHVLRKLSVDFPEICVQVTDRDGEILLIEAADVIPKWLKPENSRNRVWLWNGSVLLLTKPSDDAAVDEEGMSFAEARQILSSESCSSFIDEAVSTFIQHRVAELPLQHLASRHTADVVVPRRCAAALCAQPLLVAVAVNTLCDADENLKADIANMDVIGVGDFVSIPVVFTRLQYAQLMFQNFEPPALMRLAEKRFDFKDKKAVKALDVGFRLACGLEAAAKKAKRLRDEIRDWKRYQASSAARRCNCAREDHLTEYLNSVEYRCYGGVEAAIAAAVAGMGPDTLSLPAVAAVGGSFRPGRGESDRWLYMTPEAMDEEMAARVRAMKGGAADGESKPASSASRASDARSSKEGLDVDSLTGVVKGLEGFIAGESGLDGVELRGEGGADSDYFSEDSDADASDSDGETAAKYKEDPRWGPVSLAEEEGDIVLNMDKLLHILEDYQSASAGPRSRDSGEKKKKAKKKKLSKDKNKSDCGIETLNASQDPGAAVVCGTAVHTLPRGGVVESASGACVVGDCSDSGCDSDSDDADSDDATEVSDRSEDSEDNEDVEDDEFYKEYQDAMDGELSGTTLKESFLRQSKPETVRGREGAGDASDLLDKDGAEAVDEDLNMLTHLLESHASQLGPAGPVGNLLSAMGVSLPTVNSLEEGNHREAEGI